MSRRKRRGCSRCGRPAKWILGADGHWKLFEPAPVNRTGAAQVIAFPVENGARWWRPRDLVEDLMTRHEYSRDQAQTEADAMPWYTPHTCLSRPDDQEDELSAHDPAHTTSGGER